MIPVHTPDVADWNALWAVIVDVFEGVGVPLFRDTYFQYLALFLLLVGVAMFLWKWFKAA